MIELPNTDRGTLAEMFRLQGHLRIVEVGTERGKYAEVIASKNPQANIWCVDPFEPYPGYREHVTVDKLSEIEADARRRLAPYNVTFIKKYSVEAAKDFPDGSLDAVYIDANHEFVHVVADIAAWYPKIRKGGIISGHDFVRRKRMNYGVIDAVVGFTKSYNIAEWYVLGRKEHIEGELRDKSRSWFWVKK